MTCIIDKNSIMCYRGGRRYTIKNKVTKEVFAVKMDKINFDDLSDDKIVDVIDKSNYNRKFQKKFLEWIFE